MIRTPDLLVRSQTLYPTELRAQLPQYTQPPSRDPLFAKSTAAPASGIFHTERGPSPSSVCANMKMMPLTIRGVEPARNEALADIEKKTGPSNFFRTMAHRPQAMQDFFATYNDIMGAGALERRLKEIVYLAVSTVNECDYCTAHHVRSGLAASLTAQEIQEIRTEQNQNFNPKEIAALHYARELTRTCAAEGDTRDALHELFTAEQLVELTLVIALANFTNRFNNGLMVPVEDEHRHV